MIEFYNNLLTEDEKQYLKYKCDNFIETHSPFVDGKTNRSYHKYKLDEKTELLGLQNRLTDLMREKVGNNVEFLSFVINRVTVETNKNDQYHVDKSDFTIVTYLDDDFDGGDFVYSLDNIEHKHIKVKKDLSILMNNEVPHKITPITRGMRYSFACFFNYLIKSNKSLI
jgi:hypothetical protein